MDICEKCIFVRCYVLCSIFEFVLKDDLNLTQTKMSKTCKVFIECLYKYNTLLEIFSLGATLCLTALPSIIVGSFLRTLKCWYAIIWPLYCVFKLAFYWTWLLAVPVFGCLAIKRNYSCWLSFTLFTLRNKWLRL